ncbi:MAG: HupE/UreJ family protein [Candidatus Didemnitutus sp.]|nr:HupE/UreJ family protein [Candidatus Didemnitutus sp.]
MKFLLLLATFLGLTANAFAHGMSEADKAAALAAGNFEFIKLGAGHMLTGYDHLLFLFGVMFFLTKFKDIVKFITAFTIGHCITLIFATLFHIRANYFLIDAVIALTVCYKAFDNLDGFKKWLGTASPNLLGMVFAFGLIHGFGLSTRLQQLPLGDEGLVMKILSFNVGVEVGQILALVVMAFFLSFWRNRPSFAVFSKVGNSTLFAAGVYLFFTQMHGFQHTDHPDDFPLNKDDHYHVHQDMLAPVEPAPLAPPSAPAPSVHSHGDGAAHSH